MTASRCRNCGDMIFRPGQGRPSAFCARCKANGFGRYGSEHQRRRAAGIEAAYYQPCSRCGKVMLPGQELHLDHLDGGGPNDYLGFSHSKCNEAAGGRLASARRRGEAAAARVTPHDPGPEPEGLVHRPDCACADKALAFGRWPTECW